jgi:hypothetical protein
MTWDGEMTKTKVVDLQKLYNFVIDIFFTWIHLCFEILISKSDKDKHKKGGVDRGDKRKPLWPPITHFSRENHMTYDCLMASSLKKLLFFGSEFVISQWFVEVARNTATSTNWWFLEVEE